MTGVVVREKGTEYGIWCIPIKELLLEDPLFELAERHDFSRTTIVMAVVGIADALLGNELDYTHCSSYITKTLPNASAHRDLVEAVMRCATRIAEQAPVRAKELLYLRSGQRNIYLRISIESWRTPTTTHL